MCVCACAPLLLLAVLPALAGPRVGVAQPLVLGAEAAPAFALRQRTSLVARVGDTAHLRCRVTRLADRAVSWVRSSDLQILTHAGAVFTADARVSCSDTAHSDTDPYSDTAPHSDTDYSDVDYRDDILTDDETVHTLSIERLRVSDSGRYECQVNTEPKMSLFFNLTVIEFSVPEVVVTATSSEVLGEEGGAATLACEARYGRDGPGGEGGAAGGAPLEGLPALRIRWYHDGELLDPQSGRGGISVESERWAGGARSRLTVSRLARADAGRYACAALRAQADVLLRLHGQHADGEAAEWMQRDQPPPRAAPAAAPPGPGPAPPALAALAACSVYLLLT